MAGELSSSQESLPLSQETFLYSWNGIPAHLREVLCSDNLSNFLNPNVMNSLQDASLENHDVSAQQSSLPSTEDFPGFFNFTVTVPSQEVASKASLYVYSSLLNRLYVRKDTPCPFNFSASECLAELVEPSVVRGTIFFSSPENINDVVNRCVNHQYEDAESGKNLLEHILKSESRSAKYYEDSVTKRYSVVVPFDKPPMGQNFSTYVYKFSCYTSCPGGPNRRPICVVFTLENKGQILGRRKIDVRVCSCPYRDKAAEEEKLASRNENAISQMGTLKDSTLSGSSLSDVTNNCKSTKSGKRKRDGEGKEYIIKVRNEECYKLLKGVKTWYELVKHVQSKNHWVPSATDVANLLNALTSSESDNK